MGLFAFNRMRLKREESMRPENVAKAQEEEVKEEVVEQPEEVVEVKEEEVKEPVKRGSSRKK